MSESGGGVSNVNRLNFLAQIPSALQAKNRRNSQSDHNYNSNSITPTHLNLYSVTTVFQKVWSCYGILIKRSNLHTVLCVMSKSIMQPSRSFAMISDHLSNM